MCSLTSFSLDGDLYVAQKGNLLVCQPFIFELTHCRQLTFCCLLSEINMLAVKG